MRVAIIGAGFAGLSVGFYLTLKGGCEVTLFDSLGVGKGASGVASGLAHPYTGEQIRRSCLATESLAELILLLDILESETGSLLSDRSGIYRYPQDEEQRKKLQSHCIEWKDVKELENGSFWITSGITLYAEKYLEALSLFIKKRGGIFKNEEVVALGDLSSYDRIVIAAGSGSLRFPECAHLPCNQVKGQVWVGEGACGLLEKSSIGKGYVALDPKPGVYHLGSTYERGWKTPDPEFDKGLERMLGNTGKFFKEIKDLRITQCHAGIRLTKRGHYFPVAEKLDFKTWVLTALGSRGILYHAYLGKQIAEVIR